jgi:hypothetical protein
VQTGKSYEHRRAWLKTKLLELPRVFAIDAVAYDIMNNHYHSVIYLNVERAKTWSDLEVVERWYSLFSGAVFSQRYLKGDSLDKTEMLIFQEVIDEWRARVQEISWFMRVLNESIARSQS